MRRTFSILLACLLLLTACGEAAPKSPEQDNSSSSSREDDRSLSDQSDSGSASQPDDSSDSDGNIPGADDPQPLVSFNYAVETVDTPLEFARILAFGQDDSLLWEYTTQKMEITELERVSPIGLVDDGYFFISGGSVVCLDAWTGQERWTNSDFGGAQPAFAIGDGIIYLSGYYGPDLFAVSTNGETVKKIDSLDDNYFWPCELELSGNILTVTMSGGPEGTLETGHPIQINLTTWSYGAEQVQS